MSLRVLESLLFCCCRLPPEEAPIAETEQPNYQTMKGVAGQDCQRVDPSDKPQPSIDDLLLPDEFYEVPLDNT